MPETIKDRVTVIPNACPNVKQTAKPSVMNSECYRAIVVSRLEEKKGYLDLIAAFSVIANDFPQWTIDIYGHGSLKNTLINQIKKHRLESKVFLKGTTTCLLYTSPSPRDQRGSRMPSSA